MFSFVRLREHSVEQRAAVTAALLLDYRQTLCTACSGAHACEHGTSNPELVDHDR
ncbi:hypothetical protein [Candidatus Nitrotoga fabula]|uniref:hypothetical protein n=1 Tax=Candidatus Nitrotoga fabula TaxID=2182327 RepID=UPI001BB4794E|nr:hypothetical protein [Candidatus Nitrotoga fabula]